MWRSSLAALALMLGGCAATAPAPPAPPPGLQYAGRFSVSWREAASDENPQRASGLFALRVEAQRSELEVSSPLGQTLAVATVTPEAAVLSTADGRRIRAERAEALTEQAFGWPAPLSHLPRWLAAPAAGPLPASFEDSGWQVAVESWQGGLPRRLTLRWPAAPAAATGREVELRLLVDEVGAAAALAAPR